MNKDWNGNTRSVFVTTGASNHSGKQRPQLDYYATSEEAVHALLQREIFIERIWEPACGENHITNVIKQWGYEVYSSDVVQRGVEIDEVYDFLSGPRPFDGNIITNPPYSKALEFVEMALRNIPEGNKVAMLLRLQFLEGLKRRDFFEKSPPVRIYVFSKRIRCALNGDFQRYIHPSAMSFAWFVWVKGERRAPIIQWI